MTTTPGGPGNGPEFLDGPGPLAPATAPTNDNKKRLILLGAIAGGGAVIAGGAWAATSFFATGSQPSEALPDSTIAYVSVDLDPSGAQKLEALRTLRKFPAFTDNLDVQAEDDIRKTIFDNALGECDGVTYDDDIAPWIGSRAALAAVDLGDGPTPVGVVQVSDSGRAEDGMAALVEACGGSSDDSGGGWVVDGDWMVVAESEDLAQQVVDASGEATLAADDSFTKWTGEAGDEGFMSIYISKEAAKYAGDAAGVGEELGGSIGLPSGSGVPSGQTMEECLATAAPEDAGDCFDLPSEGTSDSTLDPAMSEELSAEMEKAFADFDGAAATIRFNDGAVEVEYAASNYQPDLTKFMENTEGASMVAGLPEDTVAAIGFGLNEGWAQGLLDYVKTMMPDEAGTIDQQLADFEAGTGLAFPEDIETLLGEGVTVSLGSGLDADAITNGGPTEIPVGISIQGDAAEIQTVLDKISALAGPEAAEFLKVTEGDGRAVIALKDDYRTELEGSDGGLGSSDAYDSVVDGDAQSVVFVNFDADDNWLARVSGDDPVVTANVEPLSAFGISSWVDGDVMHGMVKLTTD